LILFSTSSVSYFLAVVHIQREARLDFALEFYGKLPLNQSQSRPGKPRHQIASLSPQLDGQAVVIRARVHTLRAQGNKMVFLNLRQRTDSVQAILEFEDRKVSKFMVKWASGLASESIVLVEGVVQKPLEEIKSATIKDAELKLTRVRTPLDCLHH
jgi:aspartyl-tRNA synthetase